MGRLSLVLVGAVAGWGEAVLLGRALASSGGAAVLCCAAVVAALGALCLTAWWPPWARGAVLPGVAVFCAVFPYERALGGTVWAWNGLSGDQTFRTEYLSRFADSPRLADYTYAHLPAFYPPAWFWVVGRAARVLDVPAWQALRPATTLTMVVTVVVATTVAAGSLSLGTAGTCVALAATFATTALWEPYSLLASFLVFAVLVRLPRLLASPPLVAIPRLTAAFSAVFLSYTYGAVILALSTLAVAALSAQRRRSLLLVSGAGAAALVLTAWYWVRPLLVNRPSGRPAQMTWLSSSNTHVPWQLFGSWHASSVVAVAGAAWIVLVGWRTAHGRALATFAALASLWCLVSVQLSHAASVQLQPNRVGELLFIVCCAAAGLAARDVHRWLGSGVHGPRGRTLLAARSGLVVAVAVGVAWTSSAWTGQRQAPGAVEARSTPLPTHDERVLDVLRRTLRRPDHDLVIVSSWSDVLAISAVHGFQQWDETYANPGAQFKQREGFLVGALRHSTSTALARRLRTTPWGPIDALVLQNNRSDYVYRYVHQDAHGHDRHVEVRLPKSSVTSPAFRVVVVDGDSVLLPREPG